MSTLVILSIESEFSANSSKLLGAAQKVEASITVLIHESMNNDDYLKELSFIEHISDIVVMDYQEEASILSKFIAQWAKEQQFETILASDQYLAQIILPRVAALLDVGQVSNISEVVSKKIFKHPIYAGNAIETVEVVDNIVIGTVRCSAFSLALKRHEVMNNVLVLPPLAIDNSVTLVETIVSEKGAYDLSSAKWVIGIGRGVNSESTYSEIYDLAEKVGFAIGGTRAVIDAGMMTNDKQIGQTGKIIAPEVYIALGISGAIQHLAGILGAKKIIAVNCDTDAPIMEIADFAFIGNVEDFVPQLKNALLD